MKNYNFLLPMTDKLSVNNRRVLKSFYCPKCGKEKRMIDPRGSKTQCLRCKMKG